MKTLHLCIAPLNLIIWYFFSRLTLLASFHVERKCGKRAKVQYLVRKNWKVWWENCKGRRNLGGSIQACSIRVRRKTLVCAAYLSMGGCQTLTSNKSLMLWNWFNWGYRHSRFFQDQLHQVFRPVILFPQCSLTQKCTACVQTSVGLIRRSCIYPSIVCLKRFRWKRKTINDEVWRVGLGAWGNFGAGELPPRRRLCRFLVDSAH